MGVSLNGGTTQTPQNGFVGETHHFRKHPYTSKVVQYFFHQQVRLRKTPTKFLRFLVKKEMVHPLSLNQSLTKWGDPLKKADQSLPIGSMGLVYLPTFSKTNRLNVGKYNIPFVPWIPYGTSLALELRSSCPTPRWTASSDWANVELAQDLLRRYLRYVGP